MLKTKEITMKMIACLFVCCMMALASGCSSVREMAPSSADSSLGNNPGFTGDYQVLRDMDSRNH